MSLLQYQAGKDKEAMEEDYQKALELIFAYGNQPEVLDGMPDSSDMLPPEFLVNPRCPLALVATKVTVAEAKQGKTTEKAKDPERSALVEDFVGTS